MPERGRPETRLVSSLLRQGDVFVDVGANVGYFTLIASDAVGKTGKVFAFEPEPNNFALLRKNAEVNHCANVVCEQKAITNANQPIKLYLSSFNYGDHRIFQSHDDEGYNRGQERPSTKAEGVTLDSYFPSGTRIDFIKMDVQGAEYFALQGMERVLRDNADVVLLIEFWPHGLRGEDRLEPFGASGRVTTASAWRHTRLLRESFCRTRATKFRRPAETTRLI